MTTATSSATSSIVSALGAGSGIDMAALASNLAAAQFSVRSDRLTAQAETLDAQISAASNLKSMLLSLSSSLGDRVRQGDLAPTPQIANPAVARATLSGAATPSGSYTLEVTALAASQTLASSPLAASTTPVGSGTLTLRFGTIAGAVFTEDTAHAAVDITIASGATLTDVAAAINGSGSGVSAYVANTVNGAQLVLKGKEGAANGFVLEATEDPLEPGLAQLAWEPATGAPARLLGAAGDAAFKIDGLAMSSPRNSVSNVVPGVDLALTGTNVGAPTRITFSDPVSAISSVMTDLTAALNELAGEIKTDTEAKTGDLARDSGARELRRMMAQLAGTVVMPNAPAGAPRTLADLGLSTQRDGTFVLDSKRLAATLKADPQNAAAMFTNGLYGVYGTIDGLVRKAVSATNPGSLAGSIARYTAQKAKNAEQLSKLTEQQEELRARLVTRFAATDSRVGEAKSTLSFLQNQIDAWNAQGRN